MSLMGVKLRRDLRATWPRLVLMVVAIAVSLTVFGGVLFAWSAIGRETEQAYLGTEPASATIRFGPGVDAEEMAAIAAQARTRPGVIEATGRTQFTSEIEVNGRPRDIPLQVFVAAPDEPMRMATFQVQQGSWPPSVGDVFIRRDSFTLLDVAVGDTVTVTTPGGKRARLRVAGTVYDPSLAPAPQQQTGQAYLSTASLAALGEPDVLDQLKIQVAGPGQATPSRDRHAIVAVAGEVGQWLQREHGLAIREIQVPKPYAHPHQGQADALLSALLVGAGAALLLATILVANMLGGLFTQQIPQIGIMKAIGARSARIGRLYLAMTLIVAGAATLLALPLGILIGRGLAPNVLGFLGIQAASVAAAWWTYLVILAAGLVLPVLMALVPLVKTSRTTVRAAIDHHGASANPRVAAAVLAWIGRARRPARFLLSVGLLAGAGMMFVAGMSAREGTQAVAEQATERLRWDVVVQLANSTSVDALAPVVAQVPGVNRVEGWTISSAGVSGPGKPPLTLTYPDQCHHGVFVTAIPADTTMLTIPTLREGSWLESRETGAIVLSQVTLASTDFDVHAGGTVQLSINGTATTWRVVGIAEERGDAGGAYVTAEGLAKAMGQPQWSNTLRIAADRDDEQTRAAVARAVETRLTDAGVDVLERTREFGVMHAIGARPKTVRRIVVAEGVFIALASCLLAAIPALGLTAAMDALLGNLFFYAPLPLRISFLAAAIWTALVVLGAMLATEAAATRASRLTVREALAYL